MPHLDRNTHHEKTRTISFDTGFRFLGAEIQGDSILLPFEKLKAPKRALWISARMPAALLRSYRAGHLKGDKPFVWKAHSEGAREAKHDPQPAEETPAGPRTARLALLAGGTRSRALDGLRRPA